MKSKPWMIYGATGHVGREVVRLAKLDGRAPILGGRDLERTRAIASPCGFESRALPLDDPERLREGLEDLEALLFVAGPAGGSRALMEACIDMRTHAVDITPVGPLLAAAYALAPAARAAGIGLVPASGIDIALSDALLARLIEGRPRPQRVRLTYRLDRDPPWLAAILAPLLARRQGVVRSGGMTTPCPFPETRTVDFHGVPERALLGIPMPELESIPFGHGIGEVEVLYASPDPALMALLLDPDPNPDTRSRLETRLAGLVGSANGAPTRLELLAEVEDEAGHRDSMAMEVPLEIEVAGERVSTTALLAYATLLELLEGRFTGGAYTPAQVLGIDRILQISDARLDPQTPASSESRTCSVTTQAVASRLHA